MNEAFFGTSSSIAPCVSNHALCQYLPPSRCIYKTARLNNIWCFICCTRACFFFFLKRLLCYRFRVLSARRASRNPSLVSCEGKPAAALTGFRTAPTCFSSNCIHMWGHNTDATGWAVNSKCDTHLGLAPPSDASPPVGAASYVTRRLQCFGPRTPRTPQPKSFARPNGATRGHVLLPRTTLQTLALDRPQFLRPHSCEQQTSTTHAKNSCGPVKWQSRFSTTCTFSEDMTNLPSMTHRTMRLMDLPLKSFIFPTWFPMLCLRSFLFRSCIALDSSVLVPSFHPKRGWPFLLAVEEQAPFLLLFVREMQQVSNIHERPPGCRTPDGHDEAST